MERWQRQFIRYLFPYSASRLRIEHAFLAKHPHVPQLLYKYRDFTPSHLDALRRGVLFMSSPDRFNDPFDTTVFFDPKRFIVENLSPQEFIKQMNEELRSGTPWRPKSIKNPVRKGDWMRGVMKDLLKDTPANARDALISQMEDWSEKQSKELRQQMSERLRKGFSVLSLFRRTLHPF
jgi:hypothetical protein